MTETTLSYISPTEFAFKLREKVPKEWAKQRMPDGIMKIIYGIKNIAGLIHDPGQNGATIPTADDIREVLSQEYLNQVIIEAVRTGLRIER